MFDFTIQEIADVIKGKCLSKNINQIINGFSIDSRTIKKNEVFIAIKGKNFDGHDYIEDLIDKDVCAVIINKNIEYDIIKDKIKNIILVDDTYKAIEKISSYIRQKFKGIVICVTGTNGKTTVKEFLSDILSLKYKVLKSEKSYNNLIGVSLTLFNLDFLYDILILEL